MAIMFDCAVNERLHFSIERQTGQIGKRYEKGTDKSMLVIIKLFYFHLQNGSAFLLLACPGCPGKEAIKWVLFLLRTSAVCCILLTAYSEKICFMC